MNQNIISQNNRNQDTANRYMTWQKKMTGENKEAIKVKICGLTDPQEADYVNEAKADFAGMVLFFPKSKRNISISQVARILKCLDSQVASVAVTVRPDVAQIRAIEDTGFSYIQIHGDISDELLDSVRIPVLKAFNVSDLSQFAHYEAHPNVAGFVLDAQMPGSGKTFDWSLLEKLPHTEKLILLAGGLNPQNVGDALRRTGIRGADTSSGVERADGHGKDRGKVLAFVNAARRV